MSDELKPKLDEFTSKVVTDPAKPQETLLLQGFLGASSQPDHTRVYSDLNLDSYVDVANADIIHVEPMPKEQSPMGGSYLWVKKEADAIPATTPGATAAKAKFLEGPIASEAATGAAQPALPRTVPIIFCHPTIVLRACPPPTPRCPSIPLIHCPTQPVVCHQTVVGPECPVRTPACPQQVASIACGEQQPGAAQFAAEAARNPVIGFHPTADCPSRLCPPPPFTLSGQGCIPQTPRCPQIALPHTLQIGCNETIVPSVHVVCPTIPAVCHQSIAISVCHICPPQTHQGPECPVHTPLCPPQPASLACGVQTGPVEFALAAPQAPALPATHVVSCPAASVEIACPVTVATRPCPPPTPACPTPLHRCPTPLCPTPRHMCPSVNQFHCPSVAGFDCPSVNRFHCPSVASFDCPSVNEFHCPSVNNFQCPPRTTHAADCPPTPQIQHCPTPNHICPQSLTCPSFTDTCPTEAGPNLC